MRLLKWGAPKRHYSATYLHWGNSHVLCGNYLDAKRFRLAPRSVWVYTAVCENCCPRKCYCSTNGAKSFEVNFTSPSQHPYIALLFTWRSKPKCLLKIVASLGCFQNENIFYGFKSMPILKKQLPPQETLFCYVLLYASVKIGMLPILRIRLSGTRDIRYFWTKLFFTSICPLLITFATKLYLRSETFISYKFYAGYHI